MASITWLIWSVMYQYFIDMNVDWCSTQLDHWSSRSILSINQQLRSKVLNQNPFYHFHQRIFNWRCQGFEFETFCPSFWAERAVPFHQAESTGGGGGSGKKISSCLEDGELPFARPTWRATGPGRQDKWPTRVILALQHCVRLLLLRGSSQQSLAVFAGSVGGRGKRGVVTCPSSLVQ